MLNQTRGLVATFVFIVFFTGPEELVAWGNEGHKIVGEIAWQEMTPEAREEIREFLPQGTFGTLYAAATWPDVYARKYKRYDWLKPFHYIESDAGAEDIGAQDLACSECVVKAIERFSKQLTDDSERFYLRVNALRFIAHFVGDIHQPLHTGHPDGRGGNRTDVRFDGKWVNLHKLWDTSLIRYHLARITTAAAEDAWERDAEFGALEDADWEEYARRLLTDLKEPEMEEMIEEWKREADPATWAEESFDLMRQHCSSIEDGAKLQVEYYDTSMPVVSLRLQQAGIRLAELLNNLAEKLD